VILTLLPLAARNLWRRNRTRTVLTILAIATATVVFSAVMVIPHAIDSVVRNADRSPRLAITNRSAMQLGLPESYYSKIARVPGVVAVSRMIWFGGIYDDPKHQFPTIAIDADNPDVIWPEYAMNRQLVTRFKQTKDSAVVGIATMHRFGWHLGQLVALRSQIFPVTLTFRLIGTISKGPDLTVFMFHRDYLEEAIHNPGRVSMLWARCANVTDTSRVAAAIDEMFQNSADETRSETEKAFMANMVERYEPLKRVVAGIGLCAVIAIGLAVLNATAMTMRERSAEIAVLRSLGFGAAQILAEMTVESGLAAVPGGIVGVALAAVLLERARGFVPALGPLLSFGLPHSVMAAGLAMAVAVGIAAGLAPALAALRSNVVSSTRGAT
jgi:putative ABC transport system permease protein